MKIDLINELLSFRKGSTTGEDLTVFFPVELGQIAELERETNINLPPQLRQFYELIGHGSIQKARNGFIAEYDLNIIIAPERLKSFVLRTEPTFLVDETIFEEGDLPFFDIGSYSFLVMRLNASNPDAIYWPYDRTVVSQNIWEFVDKILDDPRFYHKVIHEFTDRNFRDKP